MLSSIILVWHKKFTMLIKIFVMIKNFLINTFKVALQYLYNVLILFKTVFYLKFYVKVTIDQSIIFKTCNKFRN